MRNVLLYSTAGCHLCELAKEVVYPLLDEFNLHLTERDIADDDELVEAYGVRIPVLLLPAEDQTFALAGEDLGWPFDRQQAREYLRKRLSETA